MEINSNVVGDTGVAEATIANTVEPLYATVHKTRQIDSSPTENLNKIGKDSIHYSNQTSLESYDQASAIGSNMNNLDVFNINAGNLENVADINTAYLANEDGYELINMRKDGSELIVEYASVDDSSFDHHDKKDNKVKTEDKPNLKPDDTSSAHSENVIADPPSYNDVFQADDDEHEYDEPSPKRESPVPKSTKSTKHNYHPRLCHIKKWPDFQGYGFNLHAEKDKKGQYIGLVDENSPSESANLKKGDRIIEVNGENVEDQTHQYAIQRIKAGGDETKLLVVDSEADEYYKNNAIKITSKLPEVIFCETKVKEATKDVKKEAAKEATKVATAVGFAPRLCHIVKWPDFNGYGFNLHAEKERGGQYIGKIDKNSPAEDGGLRESDRIIEVNGVNIENEIHQQVIAKIKAGGDETKLLVVDREADQYYKSKGITVTSTMTEVKQLRTARKSLGSSSGEKSSSAPQPHKMEPAKRIEPIKGNDVGVQKVIGSGDLLSMNLSAKEMRELLAAKKKQDPKLNSNMDFKSKFELFQKM